MGKDRTKLRAAATTPNSTTKLKATNSNNTHARFYEYYELLNMPQPTQFSPPNASGPVDDPQFSPTTIKKFYRKASLQHHPDRGGDPQTFIKLKRASKVLADSGLRARYNILGLDTGRDDGATSKDNVKGDDDNDSNVDNSGQSASILFSLNKHLTTYALQAILQSAALLCVIFLIQFSLVAKITFVAALGLSVLYASKTKFGKTLVLETEPKSLLHLIRAAFVCGPFLIFGVYLSGGGGWYFWVVESALLFLAIGIPTLGLNPKIIGGVAVFAAMLSWWLKGRFFRWVCLLAFEVGFGIFWFLVFQGCDYLVNISVEEMMGLVGQKLGEAVNYERDENRTEIRIMKEKYEKTFEEKDRAIKLWRTKVEEFQRLAD